MRALTALAVVAAALSAAGAASAAPSIRVKDAVARVVIIPENRSDVKVEMLTTNAKLPLMVRQKGDQTIVDGDLGHKINSCNRRDGKVSVRVRGVGEFGYDDFPQIAVRVPMNAKVAIDGAVFGDIGRSDSVELSNAGCGDWTVANTRGELQLNSAGSGDTRTGDAGTATYQIAGSGDVWGKVVSGDVKANIAGSGNVTLASVTGDLDANIAGSGDITIAGGRGHAVKVNVAGSGDVDFKGEVNSVDVNIVGSGDVRVARVNGPVSKHVLGSGDVIIGH